MIMPLSAKRIKSVMKNEKKRELLRLENEKKQNILRLINETKQEQKEEQLQLINEKYKAFIAENILITHNYNDKIKTSDYYSKYFKYSNGSDTLKKGEFYAITNALLGMPRKTNGYNYYRGIKIKGT
jgi:hypothetical protein